MPGTAFDVKAHWSAMISLGEAVLALKNCRDQVLIAHGSTMAAATLVLLHETANALLKEMGTELRGLAHSPDPEIQAVVMEIMQWFESTTPVKEEA